MRVRSVLAFLMFIKPPAPAYIPNSWSPVPSYAANPATALFNTVYLSLLAAIRKREAFSEFSPSREVHTDPAPQVIRDGP